MAAAAVVRNVFVYGSLLAPEVLSALLHRVPTAALAVVHNHHRYSLKGRIYPAVVPKKGDKVFGKVLFDISDQELHILDEFEDIEYKRLTVSPLTLKAHDVEESVNGSCNDEDRFLTDSVPNGQTESMALDDNSVEISPGRIIGLGLATEVPAFMYVWVNEADPDLVGNWDYEEWRTKHLKDFLEHYFGRNSG